MDYLGFKNKFQNIPIILSKDVVRLQKDSQNIRNQLNRWQSKGLIIKLKRGMYLLNKNDRKVSPSKHFIANQLYQPSYVSLEYALSFYGLIPERVSDVTSITTKKTNHFRNKLGVFIYQHIKPEAFKGFNILKEENGLSSFIAEPEKAIIDFLYLNLRKFRLDVKEILRSSYRFQNLEGLRQKKITDLAKAFNNHRLMEIARYFCEFIREEAKQ